MSPLLALLVACRVPYDPKGEDPGVNLEETGAPDSADSGHTEVGDSGDSAADSGEDTDTQDSAVDPVWPTQRLMATFADWSTRTGGFALYDWPSMAPLSGTVALDGADHRVDCDAGPILLLSRNTGVDDTARVLSPDDGSVTATWSFGADTQPWDVAAVGDDLWVALRGAARIDVVTADGAPDGSIDLTAHADTDGTAEPASIRTVDGVTYVLLGGHDEDDVDVPFGTPQLLALDPATRALQWSLALSGRVANVLGAVEDGKMFLQARGLLTRTDTGAMERHLVGGMEVVDLAARTTSGLVLTEEALGATIDFFSVRAGTGTAWLITTDVATGMQTVNTVDLTTWTVTPEFVADGFAVRVMIPQDDGTLWLVESVTREDGTSEGAYVHRDADFAELERIDLGEGLTGVTICEGG